MGMFCNTNSDVDNVSVNASIEVEQMTFTKRQSVTTDDDEQQKLEVPVDQIYNLIDLRGSTHDWCYLEKKTQPKGESFN